MVPEEISDASGDLIFKRIPDGLEGGIGRRGVPQAQYLPVDSSKISH